jgi:hypothetical protein
MRDHNQCAPLTAKPGQEFEHAGTALVVKPSERLVEYQHPRVTRQQSGQRSTTDLSTAQLLDRAGTETLGIESDQRQSFLGFCLIGAARGPDVGQKRRAQQLQPGMLKGERNFSHLAEDGFVVQLTEPRGGPQQSGKCPGQGRFARPVLSDNEDPIPFSNVYVDVVERWLRPGRGRGKGVAEGPSTQDTPALAAERGLWLGANGPRLDVDAGSGGLTLSEVPELGLCDLRSAFEADDPVGEGRFTLPMRDVDNRDCEL